MVAFIGGTATGAKSTIAQGLVNKMEVLIKDSKVANEIRAERADDIKEVEKGFNEIKLSDCAKRFTMRELMGLQSDTDYF